MYVVCAEQSLTTPRKVELVVEDEVNVKGEVSSTYTDNYDNRDDVAVNMQSVHRVKPASSQNSFISCRFASSLVKIQIRINNLGLW